MQNENKLKNLNFSQNWVKVYERDKDKQKMYKQSELFLMRIFFVFFLWGIRHYEIFWQLTSYIEYVNTRVKPYSYKR